MGYGYVHKRVANTPTEPPPDPTPVSFAYGQIAPSDDVLLDPRPWGGIEVENDTVLVLADATGNTLPIRLAAGTLFTGLIPERVMAMGTDFDAVIRARYIPNGSLAPTSGDRILRLAPSDAAMFNAVGGLYIVNGGFIRYETPAGVVSVPVAPDTWINERVIRVFADYTTADLIVYGFI